jgi:polar amino acid transport system substrate-binding protein
MIRTTLRAGAVALTALISVAACSGIGASLSPAPTSAPPTAAASSAAPASPTPSPNACAKENLTLVAPGKLTVGTDNPAYPPYFAPRTSGNTPPWDPSQGDPTTGEGFESAVAYAIADKLGFSKDEVSWVVVPFANSYAPGPKTFDFDVNQVSYTADRTQTADLSDGYYFGPQTVVTLKTSSFAKATTVTELQGAKLGAQVGTTSYDAIVNGIKPTKDASVYDSNDAAIEALKNKQIDGIVVDLPTALFLTATELDNAKVLGQFSAPGGDDWGIVSVKDSPLTPCINEALAALKSSGQLDAITKQWMTDSAGAPELQ